MSKARAVLKYSSAGALTTLYGAAAYRMITKKHEPTLLTPTQAAVTVGSLIAATWLATLL